MPFIKTEEIKTVKTITDEQSTKMITVVETESSELVQVTSVYNEETEKIEVLDVQEIIIEEVMIEPKPLVFMNLTEPEKSSTEVVTVIEEVKKSTSFG